MRISILQKFEFDKNSNLKLSYDYMSITEPDFIEENCLKFEYCGNHKIALPKSISDVFDPNRKIISILSVDKNRKKKLICHPTRS